MKPRRSQSEDQEPVDDLSDYRRHLQTAEQKSQEDFDKTVLSLSGGALGISFVFLKDVIGPNPVVSPNLLFAAWVAWGSSTFCVLASYYASHLALRRAIRQVDDGTIRKQKPGGAFGRLTALLNAAGALLFLVGVFAIVFFANANLKTKGEPSARSQAASTSTPSAAASSATAPASVTAKRPPNL
jgi:hypothetical protein